MPNNINFELIDQQDTSANALTEVALGLSMAFFALLVIALVSISLPHSAASLAASNSELKASASIASVNSESNQASENKVDTVLFFYSGKLVNAELEAVHANAIKVGSSVVLAIDPLLTFDEIVQIQQDFSHVNLQLAKLNDDWKSAMTNHFEDK